MMPKDRTEIARMVRTARISRRTRYASMRAQSLSGRARPCLYRGTGGHGPGLTLRLEIVRRGLGGPGRAAVLGVDLPRRDVPQPAGHDPDPHRGRRLADGPNRVRSEEHTSELQSRLHLVCRL